MDNFEAWYKANKQANKVSGTSPLTFKGNGKELTNYRIYGNTVNGGSVGDRINEGSAALPYGYRVPVTVTNGTDTQITNLYLPEPLRTVGSEAEYVDYKEQRQHRVRKNLLQNTATSQTINGVTFTVNGDGSVTCNGTANGITFFTYATNKQITENVILTGCPINGGYSNYLSKVQRTSDKITIAEDIGMGSRTFTPNKNIDVVIRIASGYTCNNLTFYPMIRKAEIEDDTYEPYIENTEIDVELPAIPTLSGTTTVSVDTTVPPSSVVVMRQYINPGTEDYFNYKYDIRRRYDEEV